MRGLWFEACMAHVEAVLLLLGACEHGDLVIHGRADVLARPQVLDAVVLRKDGHRVKHGQGSQRECGV